MYKFEIRWNSMKFEVFHIISWILLGFDVKKGVKRPFWLILTNFRNFAKNDSFEAILGDFGPFWSIFGGGSSNLV